MQTITHAVDIGNVGRVGKTRINNEIGCYGLHGSGADIQAKADAFHFAYTKLCGDGAITAQVQSIVNTSQYAKGGVMLRESLSSGSRHAMMHVKATTGTEFQFREFDDQETTVGKRAFDVRPPYWVRLERHGDLVTGYTSKDGEQWERQSATSIPMSTTVFVGLAATAHNNSAITTVEFENVSVSGKIPARKQLPTHSTGATGFLPLLTTETFDPYTEDGKTPSSFFVDDDEFYTYRGPLFVASEGDGYDEDEGSDSDASPATFRFNGKGELHILGIPAEGQEESFGYISTEDHYRNYHLSLEYKWGKKKFKPRDKVIRDSGLIYHAVGADVTWPTGVETQIQEGDTGDFFFLGYDVGAGRASATVTVAPNSVDAKRPRYLASGTPIDTKGGITKDQTVDSLTDWNRVEVIVEDDDVVAIVNGVVVNRATNARRPSGNSFIPLTEGRIALQAEGAEIFYRDVKIKPTHANGGLGAFEVLVFQESPTVDHAELKHTAQKAIVELAESQGFSVEVANVSDGYFTDNALSKYAAVIWNGTSGDVLNAEEQIAFRKYVQAGGGFVGLNTAASTEPSWKWFEQLVGARATRCSASELGMLQVDPEASMAAGGPKLQHPAVDALPREWLRMDGWLSFASNPREKVNVLLTRVNANAGVKAESGGAVGNPIAWWHTIEGGRSFYSGLGQRVQTYSEPLYLEHLLGGIEYAAGVSRVAPQNAIVLFDGSDTHAFRHVNGKADIDWIIDEEGNLTIVPGTGNIESKQGFTDYRLHLEFKVPVTAPGTPEQQRGNSGLYLHRSYELQILDSYGDPNFNAGHAGSLYGVKVADVNASLPAETWQTYDVLFTAPIHDESGQKTKNARITAYLNGVLIHNDVEIPRVTRAGLPELAGPQPFFLQAHDAKSHVKFRNIWVLPKADRLEQLSAGRKRTPRSVSHSDHSSHGFIAPSSSTLTKPTNLRRSH